MMNINKKFCFRRKKTEDETGEGGKGRKEGPMPLFFRTLVRIGI
jgi:hypothetical protein